MSHPDWMNNARLWIVAAYTTKPCVDSGLFWPRWLTPEETAQWAAAGRRLRWWVPDALNLKFELRVDQKGPVPDHLMYEDLKHDTEVIWKPIPEGVFGAHGLFLRSPCPPLGGGSTDTNPHNRDVVVQAFALF